MKLRALSLFALLAVASLFLTGCGKPRVELAVASQPNVNPDHSGRPSPVRVKMYELRSDLAFKQADFVALFENPVQTLGSDLIAADEIVFVPGEARTVAYEPGKDTKFVGILAGFRQMERAHWREIRAVNPEEKSRLCLELNDTAIVVIPEKAAEDWKPEEAVRSYQQRLQPVAQPEQTAAPGGNAPAAGSPAPGSAPGTAPGVAPAPGQTAGAQEAAPPQQGYVLPPAKRVQAK